MRINSGETKFAIRRQQPLLRLKQYAKSGTGDVLEFAAVDTYLIGSLVEDRLSLSTLRGVEAA